MTFYFKSCHSLEITPPTHTLFWCLNVTGICIVHAKLIQSTWNPLDHSPPGWYSPGKNTGVGCHALFQRIFPTLVSNPGLLNCKQILYHLSHQVSPHTYLNTYGKLKGKKNEILESFILEYSEVIAIYLYIQNQKIK